MVLVKRRRKTRRDVSASTLPAPSEMDATDTKVAEISGSAVYEKDGEVEQYGTQPAELEENSREPVELPGEHVFPP